MMNHPTWIGRTLSGRYRIDAVLGRGGMSTVYKATDPNLKRVVAIKLIHEHLSSDPSFVQRFESEAAAVASLRHPNIVQVFDFNNDNGVYYMVLEFVPGETLQDRLKQLAEKEGQLSLEEAIKITLNISDAVGYAHGHDMVHRDIKPANIMLDAQGRAILMDFGIVKILGGESHTSTGAVVGTVRYMSPEIIRGEAADARSDIYSLGITFYEMLSGRPPFVSDSTMTVMMMHLNDPVPDVRDFRSEIPPALVAILQKCLAKDQVDRYQSAAEFASDLRRALINLEDKMAEAPQIVSEKKVVVAQSTADEDEKNEVPLSTRMTSTSKLSGSAPVQKKSSPIGLLVGCFVVIVAIVLIAAAGMGLRIVRRNATAVNTPLPSQVFSTPTKEVLVNPASTESKTPTPQPTVLPTEPLPARIAYVIGQQEVIGAIYIMDADGSNRMDLTGDDCSNAEPAWSPDGKSLVYQSNCAGSYDIWRMDDNGGGKQALINDGTMDEREPDYSPSGQELVYVRRAKGNAYNSNGDIRIYQFGSEDLSTGMKGRSPVYSPDGSRLVYMSFDGKFWQLFIYDIANKKNKQLTFANDHCRFPAWSPDGKDIVYNSGVGKGASPTGIWIIPADGGDSKSVTTKGSYGRPDWSDTGWIVFNAGDGLWEAHADGSGLWQLTNDKGWAGSWSR